MHAYIPLVEIRVKNQTVLLKEIQVRITVKSKAASFFHV